MESTTDMLISLDTSTPLKTSSNSPLIRDLQNFIDSQVDFVYKKKPVQENNLHICQQLFLSELEGTYWMPGGYYFKFLRGIRL